MLSLRKKLYLGFFAIILLFLITVILSTTLSQRIVLLTGDMMASGQRLEVVQRLNLFTRTANDNGAEYLLAPLYIEDEFQSQFEASVRYVNEEVLTLSSITQEPRGQQAIQRFREKWTAYTAEKRTIMKLKKQGLVQQAQENYTKDSFDPIAFSLHAFSMEEQRQLHRFQDEAERTGKTIRLVNVVMASIAVVLSVLIAFLLSGYLVGRIGLLKTSAQAVAEGNLQVPDLHFKGRDELAELADAFNAMTGSLRSVIDSNLFLQQLSLRDALTGIANRRCYDETLEREWSRLSLEAKPISLILFDIDYFKKFNDLYGHQVGDSCLRQVGGVLQALIRGPHELAARYGGEEFAVLLPAQRREEAVRMAERIREAIEQLHIPHQGSEVSSWVTVSIGVSSVTVEVGGSPARLLSEADLALYAAKGSGRNRVCLYDPAKQQPTEEVGT